MPIFAIIPVVLFRLHACCMWNFLLKDRGKIYRHGLAGDLERIILNGPDIFHRPAASLDVVLRSLEHDPRSHLFHSAVYCLQRP